MNGAQSEVSSRKSEAKTPTSSRGFWCLFVTQFQGAFSDNLFKFLVIFLITSTRTEAERDQLIPVALALFALPFILFSMAGGYLADRYSKRSVIVRVKIAEIIIMAVGLVGLWLANVPLLLFVVFLMSAQSAFFGPSKYGSLPELLPEQRLSWGNGWLGLGTFIAIITGGVLAGVLHQALGEQRYWAGALLVLLAFGGTVSSLGIQRIPAANPYKRFRVNFLGDLWLNLKLARGDRVLSLAIAGSVYFWFIGALFGEPTILVYSQDVLHLSETQIGMLRACLAIGIGVGSLVAGFLSGRKIEYGLIPLGAFGMALCAALLAWPGHSPRDVAVILGALGFSGGFYVVPVDALIQHRPDDKDKGSIIAANAWLTSLGVFVASGAFLLLKTLLGLEPTTIFLIGSAVTLAGTTYAVKLMPDSLLRLVLWMLTRTIYRVHVGGRDNIPEKGGALFVCNHVSFVDALLLIAATDRHVRFMMFKGTYVLPYVKPFARVFGIIPISSEQRPRDMIKSLQTASQAIRDGHAVCIFAEGQITRTGQMLPFRRGLERIMKDVDAPIVPVALDGVWGSIFSFESKRFVWKLPHRLPYPVTVNFGAPMSGTASALEVRQAVQELQADAWYRRRKRMKPLHRAFVRTARRLPFRFAMADPMTPKVLFGGALMRTIFLAQRLKKVWVGHPSSSNAASHGGVGGDSGKMVGLLLPPSVGGALTNWVALLCGKVPVNLNYTLSEESLTSCIRQCKITTVLTSQAFLEKVKLKLPGQVVFLEDVVSSPKVVEKLAAFFMAWLFPTAWLERALGCKKGAALDDLATVIFSSGSTGEPKGVMLSHYNIGSNTEQLAQVFAFSARDRMVGVLPFFHSFGFTGTLALTGAFGIGVVFHANPLDAKTVGQLVCDYATTFLLATPTFLQLYLRGCAPEQFGSLRLVAVGAEKMPERLATAFDERFGVRPFEAYGCTECAPTVAVNTHDFRAAGFRQVGGKRGKIGHPLPGICIRIVDPTSFAPVPTGQSGLLLVRGPNVMLGYLGRPEKTAEVMRDGFYVTGDIATQDEDGFLEITDRLSRFSKIGGEMVPHIKVEEKLHELAGATEQAFVVTSVADAKKGEQLVVFHKLANEKLHQCLKKLAQCDLPNLWKPRPDAFCRVENFPLLGSGKLDLRKVKELAQEQATTTAETPV